MFVQRDIWRRGQVKCRHVVSKLHAPRNTNWQAWTALHAQRWENGWEMGL